ncbi:phage portal protein family protein [Piscirickettsia litoralis]
MAAGVSAQDEARANFLEECRNDLCKPWAEVISEILDFLPFGFSIHEPVYKVRQGRRGKRPSQYNDNKIGWHDLETRSQDTIIEWIFDEDTEELTGFLQMSPTSGKQCEVDINRVLLFRTTSKKGNPEGRSILRNAYKPWYYKKNLENVEAIGIERNLVGLLKFEIPPDYLSTSASTDQKAVVNHLEELGANVRQNESSYLIMPQQYDQNGNKLFNAELMSCQGNTNVDLSGPINRYAYSISQTMMTEFQQIGKTAVGTSSHAENKIELLKDSITAYLDMIKGVFNSHAIPRLFDLNGDLAEELPTLDYEEVKDIDVAELSTALSQLVPIGVISPDGNLEETVRESLNLPASKEIDGK